MDDILRQSDDERRIYFAQAAARLGFPPAIVEKDFWVCWTLRELFSLRDWGDHFLFKGGTSLSKGYGYIRRFSEDIDIVIAREKLGFAGDHSLRNNQLKKLRKACQEAVGGDVRHALQAAIDACACRELLTVSRDISDPDESTLLLGFSSPFTAPESYLRPEVKIEMGARSDTWPSETITIRTMVSEGLPDMVENTEVLVRALSPQRTFWEKALLLHEEHFRPEEKRRKARMARHYYDMWCLIRAGIADQAASDSHLFASVVEHRKVFFRQKWVNYETMQRGKLRILPAPGQEEQWRKDYEAMRSYLLPGDQPPTWEEIVRVVGQFEEGFNS